MALSTYRLGTCKAEKRIKQKKEPLNVLFFALYESIWKYDSLFQMMLEDANFNPMVFVCPVTNKGQDLLRTSLVRLVIGLRILLLYLLMV